MRIAALFNTHPMAGVLMLLVVLGSMVQVSDLCAANQYAIIANVSDDGAGASYSWVPEAKSGGSRLREHNMMPTVPGIRAATHGQYYYILEGEGRNRITRYNVLSLDRIIWQFSARDTEETGDVLPWALISISDHKAYLLRYGSSEAWIVDPLAESEADFKTGVLDLSIYDDGDGAPEMCAGVVVGDKVFIVLQRIDAAGAPQTAYLAVIDAARDTAIDTGMDDGGLPGIPLTVKNPVYIQYLEETGSIYVQGSGGLVPRPEYDGGIEQIDPETYATAMVLDDGDNDDHPHGYITAMAVVSGNEIFFLGAVSEEEQTLYRFDASAGSVAAVELNAADPGRLQNKHLAGLSGGFILDQRSRLWFGNHDDHRVEILITEPVQGRYSIDEMISIPTDAEGRAMSAVQIVFLEEAGVTEEVAAERPNSEGEGGNFCFIGALIH